MENYSGYAISPLRRWLSYLISILLAGQPLLPAIGAGVSAATGNTQVVQANNGVPVVNIATPNQGGISHNQYHDFNVGEQGLVLNNGVGNSQSQLGGQIQANANLQNGQAASGIINEVVTPNRSELKGYLEVAGQQASVMVANPYGITCDGCGFINTPNITLTTGKPVLGADGKLQSLEVTQGAILIEGKGLDAGKSDKFALISRAAEINAGLHARDATVILGANRISSGGAIEPIAGAGKVPTVAIDTGALGGMYANRIRLVSSEKGVGVNLGNLNARQGGISLDANGKLSLSGSLTSGSASIKAQSAALSGVNQAAGSISVQVADQLNNSGTLRAGGDMRLLADSLVNQRGDITAGESLVLQKDTAGSASREVINRSGTIATQRGDITINTAHLLNQRDELEVKMAVYNGNMQWRYRDGEYHSDFYTPTAGEEADRTLETSTSSLTIHKAGAEASISAARNLHLRADSLVNTSSVLSAGENAWLSGNTLTNQGWVEGAETREWLITDYGLSTFIAGTFDANSPAIESRVKYEEGKALNGLIMAGKALGLDFSESVSNTTWRAGAGSDIYPSREQKYPVLNTGSGGVIAGHEVVIQTGEINNQGGVISSAGSLEITSAGEISNTKSGVMASHETLNLVANGDITNSGSLITGSQVRVESLGGSINNLTEAIEWASGYWQQLWTNYNGSGHYAGQTGTLYSSDSLDLKAADSIRMESASLISGGSLSLLADDIALSALYLSDELYDVLSSEDTHNVKHYSKVNHLIANGDITLSGNNIDVYAGRFVAGGDLNLTATQWLSMSPAESSYSWGRSRSRSDVGYIPSLVTWYWGDNESVYDSISRYGAGDAGRTSLVSGGDITLRAGEIRGYGVHIDAARHLRLLTDGGINLYGVMSCEDGGSSRDWQSSRQNKEVFFGTELTGTDITLDAGGDIQLTGVRVSASGDVSLLSRASLVFDAESLFSYADYYNEVQDEYDPESLLDPSKIAARPDADGELKELGRDNGRSYSLEYISSEISGNRIHLAASDDVLMDNVVATGRKGLTLEAGNDIRLTALVAEDNWSGDDGEQENIETLASSGMLLTSGGEMRIQAGRDIGATGAGLAADGNISLRAGRDITLAALSLQHDKQSYGHHKQREDISVRQLGSEINGDGDIVLTAGRNIALHAAQLSASNEIMLDAGKDITLRSATESDYYFFEETKTNSGLLSKKVRYTLEEDYLTLEQGSLLSGDALVMWAGNDINITGSALVGTNSVWFDAANQLNITAATEEQSSYRLQETKESGLLSGGFLGFTIGSRSSKHKIDEQDTTQSHSISTVGSTAGNVYLDAGGRVTLTGIDLIAADTLMVTGDSIHIVPGQDMHQRDERLETKSSGLTIALSGVVADVINSAVTMIQRLGKANEGRLGALQGVQAALTGVQAMQGVELAQQAQNGGSLVGINLSVGMQKSVAEWHESSVLANGSSLIAGGDLVVEAWGQDKNVDSGNLFIVGSQLKSGGDMDLWSANNLLLSAAANIRESRHKNSSSGGSLGVGINFGQSTGITVSASANHSEGKENGNSTVWTEAQLDSGNQLTLHSERDMALVGAQASGREIRLTSGGDLEISSLRDSDRYDAKQISISGGFSVAIIGAGGSGSVSASRDKVHSEYDSVHEQSGIFAGEGGFSVTVDGDTRLNGAVLASTAIDDKNSLKSGTLAWSDIINQAKFDASHQGGSIGSGGGSLSSSHNSGKAEGITRAAMSGGSVQITNTAAQGQDIATLSRDVENANETISPIFNKEKEQRRLQEVRLLGEIGSQVADVVRTQGEINGLKKAREQYPALSPEVLRETDTYKAEMAKYGTGSDYQRAAQAITAVLQGLAGGNAGQALAGGVSPYVAGIIKAQTQGSEIANALAHALWGAIGAELAGGNALAGGAGAVTGELAAGAIVNALYPGRSPESLTESEKQTVSALSSLAAGLAGGLSGGSVTDAVAAAQAGKNAVENNALSDGWNNILPSGAMDYGLSVQSYVKYAQDNNLPPEQVQAGLAQMVKGDLPESADIIKAILSNNPGSDTVMALLTAEEAKDYALALLTSIPAEKALSLVGKATGVISNKILIGAAEKISTAKPGKQFTAPRDLNEQILWNQVESNPANGTKFSDKGLNLNTDPRFPKSAGFEKMTVVHKLPDDTPIEIHYQYNSITGKAYDMKIVTPQRSTADPSDVINTIKESIR